MPGFLPAGDQTTRSHVTQALNQRKCSSCHGRPHASVSSCQRLHGCEPGPVNLSMHPFAISPICHCSGFDWWTLNHCQCHSSSFSQAFLRNPTKLYWLLALISIILVKCIVVMIDDDDHHHVYDAPLAQKQILVPFTVIIIVIVIFMIMIMIIVIPRPPWRRSRAWRTSRRRSQDFVGNIRLSASTQL